MENGERSRLDEMNELNSELFVYTVHVVARKILVPNVLWHRAVSKLVYRDVDMDTDKDREGFSYHLLGVSIYSSYVHIIIN